jgi:hypothetical protein
MKNNLRSWCRSDDNENNLRSWCKVMIMKTISDLGAEVMKMKTISELGAKVIKTTLKTSNRSFSGQSRSFSINWSEVINYSGKKLLVFEDLSFKI